MLLAVHRFVEDDVVASRRCAGVLVVSEADRLVEGTLWNQRMTQLLVVVGGDAGSQVDVLVLVAIL